MAENLKQVRGEIVKACQRADRLENSVTLVAVSKTWPAEHVMRAYEAGQRHFGENKLQELEQKRSAMPDDCVWHFIGGVQRNKVRKICAAADWVHSISSVKIAATFSRICQEEGTEIKGFLQTNFAREDTKQGFAEQELKEQSTELADLPGLQLSGLMAIPPAVGSPEESRPAFREIVRVQKELEVQMGQDLPCISIGMSGDYQVAIEEGATHVRVGASIFGSRSYT